MLNVKAGLPAVYCLGDDSGVLCVMILTYAVNAA